MYKAFNKVIVGRQNYLQSKIAVKWCKFHLPVCVTFRLFSEGISPLYFSALDQHVLFTCQVMR